MFIAFPPPIYSAGKCLFAICILHVCLSVCLAKMQPICESIEHAPCLGPLQDSQHSKSTHTRILKHSQIEVSPVLGTEVDAFGYKLDRNIER